MRTAATFNYLVATNNAPPPGNQQVRTNQATLVSVSVLYVDNDTTDAINAHDQLMALVAGDEIDLVHVNPDRYGYFTVTAPPIDQTDYVEIPVSVRESGSELTAASCTLTLRTQEAPQPIAANYEVQVWGNDGYVETVGKAQSEASASILAAIYFNAQMIGSPKTGFAVVVWDAQGDRPVAGLGWNSALIN